MLVGRKHSFKTETVYEALNQGRFATRVVSADHNESVAVQAKTNPEESFKRGDTDLNLSYLQAHATPLGIKESN